MSETSKNVLIVVDVQNDFVDQALGTKEAVAMVPSALKKVQEFDGEVIFTKDTHEENYLSTQEGKMLPVEHCIRGTEGWELIPAMDAFQKENGCRVYEKGTFGSVALASDLKAAYDEGKLESVELIGLCTDICVVSNALMIKAFMPELPVYVDPACCAGVTSEKHEAALETMRSCQIRMR